MPTHVALLRGINVGGKQMSMADLREVVSSLGHRDVATYIQTGNVVFTAAGTTAAASTSTEDIAAALEDALDRALGMRPRVVVLTREDLAQAVRGNPYGDEPNPKYVHVVFFPEPPGAELAEYLPAAHQRASERGSSRDEARLVGNMLFLHTPDGFGRSELALQLLQKPRSPAASGTARNWSTVSKLLALCGG
ncbi:MAG TPA: DUF1697 domain-containing protein [Streptosporangiaceae bacterium]|nr:DUF1697 domain-containing protein [Streptosporangiaceae bacterium]